MPKLTIRDLPDLPVDCRPSYVRMFELRAVVGELQRLAKALRAEIVADEVAKFIALQCRSITESTIKIVNMDSLRIEDGSRLALYALRSEDMSTVYLRGDASIERGTPWPAASTECALPEEETGTLKIRCSWALRAFEELKARNAVSVLEPASVADVRRHISRLTGLPESDIEVVNPRATVAQLRNDVCMLMNMPEEYTDWIRRIVVFGDGRVEVVSFENV